MASSNITDGAAIISGLLLNTNEALGKVVTDLDNLSAKDTSTITTFQTDLTNVINIIQTDAPGIKKVIQSEGLPSDHDKLAQINSQIDGILKLIKEVVHKTIRHANIIKASEANINFVLTSFSQLATNTTIALALFVSASSQPDKAAASLNEVIVTLNEIYDVFGRPIRK